MYTACLVSRASSSLRPKQIAEIALVNSDLIADHSISLTKTFTVYIYTCFYILEDHHQAIR